MQSFNTNAHCAAMQASRRRNEDISITTRSLTIRHVKKKKSVEDFFN